MTDATPLRAVLKKWRHLAELMKQASRIENHDGRRVMDAYYDGKSMAYRDAVMDLEAALASVRPEPSIDLHDELHLILTKHGIASRSNHSGLVTDLFAFMARAFRQSVRPEPEQEPPVLWVEVLGATDEFLKKRRAVRPPEGQEP